MQVRNQIQRMGLRATLSLMRQTPLRDWPSRWFFPAAALQGAGAPAGGGQGGRRETHAQKVERISKRVQKLPTEEFMGREELDALPLHQLKVSSSLHIPSHNLLMSRSQAANFRMHWRASAVKKAYLL